MAAADVGSTKWVSAQEDVRKNILFFSHVVPLLTSTAT
jgi:hypothetical protein